MDRGALDQQIGRVVSDERLVSGGGSFVIGAREKSVGGLVFLGRDGRLGAERKDEDKREKKDWERFHANENE